jgi:hypothetical protein
MYSNQQFHVLSIQLIYVFVCIWEQTVIIFLYIINWHFCNRVWSFASQWPLYEPIGFHSLIPLPPHVVFMCCFGSEKKQRLLPYSALTDWSYKRDLTFYGPLVSICTTLFNIQQYYVLPSKCTLYSYFVWIWWQTAYITLYRFNWKVV